MPDPRPMGGTDEAYDLVVIGGGINGAGIARDAAMRGLRVLLLEQNDFASGTSSGSSRLIHGGLRYLEYGEISLVYESLHERRRLRRTARHLVRTIRIDIPIYESSKRGLMLLRIGMLAYDLLSLGKPLSWHRMLGREEFMRNEPGVNSDGLRGGAQYQDAQATFAERLVIENVVAAAMAGATVKNYSPVTHIEIEQGTVRAVRYVDFASGRSTLAEAAVVVNAAGPWVDRVLGAAPLPASHLIGGTKGSHIVVGTFEGAPQDAFYVEAQSDGRPFFIIPWNRQFLIGTTDIRYRGDPGEARASAREIDYLLAETNRVFPRAGLGRSDIHFAYAAVRPLPFRKKGPESAITRRHIIKEQRSARGLLSVIGGKLTTYRNLAEQVTDRACRMLRWKSPACRTREACLPGAEDLDEAEEALRAARAPSPRTRDRLLSVYGSRSREVLALAGIRPGIETAAGIEQSVLAAEAVFAIRHEYARHLVDIVHRRTMAGLSADLGASVAEPLAAAAAAELGWDGAETARQLQALQDYNATRTVQ